MAPKRLLKELSAKGNFAESSFLLIWRRSWRIGRLLRHPFHPPFPGGSAHPLAFALR